MSTDILVASELTSLLQQQAAPGQGLGLWILDEHELGLPATPIANLELLTNRFDVFQRYQGQGWSIQFSDFDFTGFPQASFDRVYYRVSKEKAVVHWILNQLPRLLKPSGELLLLGAKSEGLKGYFDRSKSAFDSPKLEKLGKGAMLAHLQGLQVDDLKLDDRHYPEIRAIGELGGLAVFSKPGLFGWEKMDAGSEFLASNWSTWLQTQQPKRVLDLGCGYGYLSLCYWQQLSEAQQQQVQIEATDTNAGAINCCQQNFSQRGIQGRVIAADCADSLQPGFDLILCNPPFHQGFGVEGELTDRFLDASQRLLRQDGQALFVVNGFVPLARKAESRFAEVDVFADNGAFKLVRLAKPLS